MNLRRLVTGSFAFTAIKAKEALLGKAASAPLSSDLSLKPEIPITPIGTLQLSTRPLKGIFLTPVRDPERARAIACATAAASTSAQAVLPAYDSILFNFKLPKHASYPNFGIAGSYRCSRAKRGQDLLAQAICGLSRRS